MRARTSALVVLIGAGIAGCGASSGGSDGESLTFMSSGGAYLDALNEAYLQPYEEATGVEIHDDPTLSYAKIETMVDAGNVTIDVTPAEGYWEIQQCGDLLLPIDRDIVDLSQVDPELIQSECGAPLITYSTAIYYNTNTFPTDGEHPTGCRDFFDTERFPGKRAVRESGLPNPLIECALIADGVPRDSLYPLDVDRAFDKIATIKDDLIFWAAGADSAQLMTSGEVAMIHAWNGRAHDAIAEQGAEFASAYGESFVIYDALVVPNGVSDPDAAMELIQFMMDPARQANLTSLIPYSPTRQDATLTNLPEPLKEFLPETNPKVERGAIIQDQQWWADNGDDVVQRWQEMFQG